MEGCSIRYAALKLHEWFSVPPAGGVEGTKAERTGRTGFKKKGQGRGTPAQREDGSAANIGGGSHCAGGKQAAYLHVEGQLMPRICYLAERGIEQPEPRG